MEEDPNPENIPLRHMAILCSSLATSTDSLISSIFNYWKEHVRTYQNFEGVEYWQPNDEKKKSQARFAPSYDASHSRQPILPGPSEEPPILCLILEYGYLSTVSESCCRTVSWLSNLNSDFADQFPQASVPRTDLLPIQIRNLFSSSLWSSQQDGTQPGPRKTANWSSTTQH